MPDSSLSRNNKFWFCAVLLFTWLARLFTLGAYPLFDKTEARYAEIAREMVVTNNWITPQFDYGTPFWGKPPLSNWVTALSLKIFGINEFAARFSSVLFALGMVWLIYKLVSRQKERYTALLAALILSTSVLFFVSGGSVMTDPALCFGTTLSMVSFWLALRDDPSTSRLWGYLFFIGLAIGLLAKGPVAAVLTAMPTAAWVIFRRKWKPVWQRIPWICGSFVTLLLVLPWYLAAERATPGFLHYFIIGEHFQRFIVKGWQGDLYGQGHAHPLGTIWFYWLLATFPWCFVFIRNLFRKRGEIGKLLRDEWLLYLLLWGFTSILFFTLAANILWTYVLPGMPAFSILLAELAGTQRAGKGERKYSLSAVSLSLITPLVFILGLTFIPSKVIEKNTQKNIVAYYFKMRPSPASRLIYLGNMPFSAEFYSQGAARLAADPEKINNFISDGREDFFVVRKNMKNILPIEAIDNLIQEKDFGEYQLLVGRKCHAGMLFNELPGESGLDRTLIPVERGLRSPS